MKNTLLFSLFILALAFLSSCKKYDAGDDPCPACPRIDYLEPNHAKGGEIITIHGSNFSEVITDNIIKINGVLVEEASILSGDIETIRVFVPAKCGTGRVSVDIDEELEFSGPGPIFNYDYTYTVSHYCGSKIGEANQTVPGLDTIARFNFPRSMIIDEMDNLYVWDFDNNSIDGMIRKVVPSGDGEVGEVFDINTNLTFGRAMTYDPLNNKVYAVTDGGGDTRDLYRASLINGNMSFFEPAFPGGDEVAASPQWSDIEVIDNIVYGYSAGNYSKIYKFDMSNTLQGWQNFIGNDVDGSVDGGPDTAAIYGGGGGIAHDNNGSLYFSEPSDVAGKIRKINLSTSVVTTISGTETGAVNDGSLETASYANPSNLFFDAQGELYLSDYNGFGVRILDNNGVETIAGGPFAGFQDGPGETATLQEIQDVVVDSQGNIFVLTLSSIKKITIE